MVNTNKSGLPDGIKIGFDKRVFGKMVDFITGLEPEQLTEQQRGNIVELITAFNFGSEHEEIVEEETNSDLCKEYQSKIKKYYESYKETFDKANDSTKSMRRII
jgi:hypothetical protein